MAAGDLTKTLGTPIKWLASGGTYAITWGSVATGNGAAGPKHTTALAYHEYEVFFKCKTNTAPTTGSNYAIYWCPSKSSAAGTDNAGQSGLINGVDENLTAPTSNQLSAMQFIGTVIFPASSTTTSFTFYGKLFPRDLYGSPLYVNNSGQTGSTTDSDFEFWITPVVYNSAQS